MKHFTEEESLSKYVVESLRYVYNVAFQRLVKWKKKRSHSLFRARRVGEAADVYTYTSTRTRWPAGSFSFPSAGLRPVYFPLCVCIYIYIILPIHARVFPFVAYNPTVRRRCCRWLRASPRDPVLTHTRTHCRRKETRPGLVVLAPRRIHSDRTRPRSHKTRTARRYLHHESDVFFLCRLLVARRAIYLSFSFHSRGATLRLIFSLARSVLPFLRRVCIYRAHHFSAAVTPGKHVLHANGTNVHKHSRLRTMPRFEMKTKESCARAATMFLQRGCSEYALKFARSGRSTNVAPHINKARTTHKHARTASLEPGERTYDQHFLSPSLSSSISVCTARFLRVAFALSIPRTGRPGCCAIYLSLSLYIYPFLSVALRRTDTATNPPPRSTHTRKTMPKCTRNTAE